MKYISTILSCLLAFAAFAGELPFISPAQVRQANYQAELMPGGAIKVTLQNQSYLVLADYSLRPGWAKFTAEQASGFDEIKVAGDQLTAKGAGFIFQRTLKRESEALIVCDKITNTSNENLPFIYRQYLKFASDKKPVQYRLCGYRIYASRGNGNDSINATNIVMPQGGGSLGMLALSDVFRVHFRAFAAKGMYGIGDDNLVIKPGVTQEMEYALFPNVSDDYYAQINAMRRYLGVNYQIQAGFTFISPFPEGVPTFNPGEDRIGGHDSVETIRAWLDCKSADYICDGSVKQLGESWHGSAWMNTCKPDVHLAFHKKIREARPSAKIFHYFHCFIDCKEKMSPGFDDCKLLLPNGNQADYRNVMLPQYLAVEGNAWADMQTKRLVRLKDEFKVDGIYWDEFSHSASDYHYGEPWDGVSADINPKSHEISRLKSSVALASLGWRKKMVEWIAANNLMFIANGGGGYTRSMSELFKKHKFIAFVETGSISNLNTVHLFTPIGLGDHITEKNEVDCYRNMLRGLDYGCLYFYYHQQVAPFTHYSLGKYMFPITPVELHEGYILGKERILTKVSGCFSFGDMSEATAHFFDANGCEVMQKSAPSVIRDGKRYYEIVLGEYESCALVKNN